MLHALLLILGTMLLAKLGVRPLRADEEAILPWYYVRAERIQRWVFGIVYGLFVLIIIGGGLIQTYGF